MDIHYPGYARFPCIYICIDRQTDREIDRQRIEREKSFKKEVNYGDLSKFRRIGINAHIKKSLNIHTYFKGFQTCETF